MGTLEKYNSADCRSVENSNTLFDSILSLLNNNDVFQSCLDISPTHAQHKEGVHSHVESSREKKNNFVSKDYLVITNEIHIYNNL